MEQDLNENEEKVDIVDEYIKKFEEHFKIESSKEINANLLKDIFHNYICPETTNSRLTKYIMRNMIDVSEKLTSTLNEKQKEQFEIYDLLHNKLMDDYAVQSFTYGFALANELNKESNLFSQEIKTILK